MAKIYFIKAGTPISIYEMIPGRAFEINLALNSAATRDNEYTESQLVIDHKKDYTKELARFPHKEPQIAMARAGFDGFMVEKNGKKYIIFVCFEGVKVYEKEEAA